MNTRISSYSASQTYNGLNDVQQRILLDFRDALTLRGSLPPDEYLSDVQIFRGSILGDGAFGHVYKGEWKEKHVAVKKFLPVTPPVFLIPSDTIRCLTLDNLQEHIEGPYKVNKRHLFLSQHPCLNPNTSGEIYAKRRGMPNLLIRLGSLTSLKNLAVESILQRDGCMERCFKVRLCVAPAGLYNMARPGQSDLRLRPRLALGCRQPQAKLP